MPRKKVVAKPKKNMKGRKRGGASVPCPSCHADSQVVLTRRENQAVARNRICVGRAQHAFLTIERVQAS